MLEPLFVTKVLGDIHLMMPVEMREKMQDPVWRSPDYHVALICYEKPSDFCHRHLVSDWINLRGIKCEEWTDT